MYNLLLNELLVYFCYTSTLHNVFIIVYMWTLSIKWTCVHYVSKCILVLNISHLHHFTCTWYTSWVISYDFNEFYHLLFVHFKFFFRTHSELSHDFDGTQFEWYLMIFNISWYLQIRNIWGINEMKQNSRDQWCKIRIFASRLYN